MGDQDYAKRTVANLRDVFKQRGIPTTGLTRKQQLIDKLLEVDRSSANEVAEIEPDPEPEPEPEPDTTEVHEDATETREDATETYEGTTEAHEGATEAHEGAIEAHEGATEIHEGITEAAEPVEPSVPEQPAPVQESKSASPSPDALEDDSRKRKRRSSTPVDAHAVAQKRAKQEDEPAHPMDTAHAPPSPVKADAAQSAEQEDAVGKQDAGEDDTAGAGGTDDHHGENETHPAGEDAAPATAMTEITHAEEPPSAAPSEPAAELKDIDEGVAPALYPTTATLYIRNLKRPIHVKALRAHLTKLALANPAGDAPAPDDDNSIDVWLDPLRTHAFARFPSATHAARVRSRLHNTIWPNEPERDQLFVDFIADSQWGDFVALEQDTPGGPQRWQVHYSTDANNRIIAELQAQGSISNPKAVFNPPTGPKSLRPTSRGGPANPAPFQALDRLYRCTSVKPKMYWRPVPEALAQERKANFERHLSRRARDDGLGGGSGLSDSRRYTFENINPLLPGTPVVEEGVPGYKGSARLVDAGPEFGLKVPRWEGRPRGGRGRRR